MTIRQLEIEFPGVSLVFQWIVAKFKHAPEQLKAMSSNLDVIWDDYGSFWFIVV
jgi:hypothetical protein